MPRILRTTASPTPTTLRPLRRLAHDVAAFLTWAAEPHLEARQQTGVKVILFLLIFTGMVYAMKRKVWADARTTERVRFTIQGKGRLRAPFSALQALPDTAEDDDK